MTYKEVPPNPSALVFSLRSIGYDVMTAVADIIDNSITAKADKVEIDFKWNDGNAKVYIKDNGCGMTEAQLVAAMRIGDKNPLDQRDKNDLGRFSMGLKTASFSQCKRLSVYTKTALNGAYAKAWDLDHILETSRWELEEIEADGINLGSYGTLVIWDKIDKLPETEACFYLLAQEVENYLSQIFHNYIGKVEIKINGNIIEPWDPFLKSNNFTLQLRQETIGETKITPYILPHDSNLSEEEKIYLKGTKGWGGHQGFYVYRNNRLIINGDWLGLYRKDDHFKLARIRIDIENTSDFQWEIDIKKSRAKVPSELRSSLQRIARKARDKAVETYRYRGKQLSRSINVNSSYVWECKKKRGNYKYSINLENEVVKRFMEDNDIGKRKMKNFLGLIEETIPVSTIVGNSEIHKEKVEKPFKGRENEVKIIIKTLYEAMSMSLNEENIKKAMVRIEPLNHYPELIESVVEELKYNNG